MEERYHIPLVLCCAEENEVALVRVLDELHKEGRAPEVVAGVDVDVDLLGRAVDRTDGPALFVLCQSDELDRNATRRLAGLFSARKAPEHRIITVQLTPQRPLSILPPIRTALKELLRAQYEKDGGDEEGKALLRDVVGPTPVTAVDRKGPDPEELARRLHKEMLAAEALLDRRGKGKPRGRMDVVESPRARSGSPAAARRATPEVVAYSGEPGAPQEQMEEESAGMPSLLPALERVPEVALTRSSPDVVQTDFTPTHARVRRREPSPNPMPRSVAETSEERPGSRVLLFVAIAGITALALMAVLHMSGDDGSARRPGDEGVPAAQRRGAGGADVEGGASAGASSAGVEKAAVSAGSASSAGADEKAGVAASAGVDEKAGVAASAGGDEKAGDEAAAEAGAVEDTPVEEPPVEEAGEADEGASPDDNPPALVPPPPRSDNEALVIDQAIADGKIRSLDALLVLKTSTDAMTWSEASDVCRSRSVANIRGWHLPSTTEIKRLRRSRMLGALTYWTRNRNAAKDEAFALDNSTGRVNLYLTVEPVARPICVRSR